MKALLTITCLFVGHVLFGQTKDTQIPIYRQKDTTLWYIWTKENIRKLGLQDLTISADPIHFRFWTERQAVDVWTSDGKLFEGKFINYTKEYDPDKYKTDKPKPEKFYSKVGSIDTSLAHQIYELLSKQMLFQIPSDDSIKGWSQGTDGTTYLVEYSTPTRYSFKEYWTPQLQIKKGIKEAATVDTVHKYLHATLDMNKEWAAFIDSLPKGCYHAGSLFLTCNDTKTKKKNRS